MYELMYGPSDSGNSDDLETFKVIHLLRAFSNVSCTAVQELTRFLLT